MKLLNTTLVDNLLNKGELPKAKVELESSTILHLALWLLVVGVAVVAVWWIVKNK